MGSKKGQPSNRRILTPEMVKEIIQRKKEGVKVKDILRYINEKYAKNLKPHNIWYVGTRDYLN